MTAPTDAEVEAMAEELWDVWNVNSHGPNCHVVPWASLAEWAVTSRNYARQAAAFRAMARVALVKLTDENGDEVRG